MLQNIFEHSYFLHALGIAIIHSFWQSALLWMVHQLLLMTPHGLTAIARYKISMSNLFLSLSFFILTIFWVYQDLTEGMDTTGAVTLFILPENLLHFTRFAIPYLAGMYLLTLLFHISGYFLEYRSTGQLRKKGLTRPDIDIRLFVKTSSISLYIKKNVQVWISENADVPAIIGHFKPVILLPAAAITQLTPAQLEAVLLHELAHVKRNDYLMNLLQIAAESILFFNPFAKSFGKQARIEREHCCDDVVLNHRYEAKDYAGALLKLEEQRKSHLQLALAATGSHMLLLCRIKRIFTGNQPNRPDKRFFFRVLVAGMFIILPALFALHQPVELSANSGQDKNTLKLNTAVLLKSVARDILPYSIVTRTSPGNIKLAEKKVPIVVPASKKQQPAIPFSKETAPMYTAYVNEEFLHPKQVLTPQFVSQVPQEFPRLIKVEEEISGKDKSRVYIFQVDRENGQYSIKPVMLINQPAEPKKIQEPTNDTSNRNHKRKVAA